MCVCVCVLKWCVQGEREGSRSRLEVEAPYKHMCICLILVVTVGMELFRCLEEHRVQDLFILINCSVFVWTGVGRESRPGALGVLEADNPTVGSRKTVTAELPVRTPSLSAPGKAEKWMKGCLPGPSQTFSALLFSGSAPSWENTGLETAGPGSCSPQEVEGWALLPILALGRPQLTWLTWVMLYLQNPVAPNVEDVAYENFRTQWTLHIWKLLSSS